MYVQEDILLRKGVRKGRHAFAVGCQGHEKETWRLHGFFHVQHHSPGPSVSLKCLFEFPVRNKRHSQGNEPLDQQKQEWSEVASSLSYSFLLLLLFVVFPQPQLPLEPLIVREVITPDTLLILLDAVLPHKEESRQNHGNRKGIPNPLGHGVPCKTVKDKGNGMQEVSRGQECHDTKEGKIQSQAR